MILLSQFILLHSTMATHLFKSIFAHCNISFVERSMYSFITSLSLELIIHNWLTVNYTVWMFNCPSLSILYWLGCILSVVSIFQLDILELLGIKQIHHYICKFKKPIQYKSQPLQRLLIGTRHPFLTGPLLILWSTRYMYLDRLLFSTAMTLYLFHGYMIDLNDVHYIKLQLLKMLNNFINGG
ncbi:uncharacterized protein TRIADDRAFT_18248 [Trichoplax adhaerens]|uniref:Nuclear envelope membrane protein n=1 Tax=Trichoplax adhaerens TaxID=10228 RepID=B3RK57_TRIAD|nr:hypothetical protein TRIADDRAFT_18248 [Trichoplax adhaerens]EDV28572.1 hypothetical protein TRIADDRAFT_18248 [Trichoplax adhaerens]|eukprot:XP_002107774.1 hypothetical protein TRIADDRAFT_18248 [Trichoplax adhaerens]